MCRFKETAKGINGEKKNLVDLIKNKVLPANLLWNKTAQLKMELIFLPLYVLPGGLSIMTYYH